MKHVHYTDVDLETPDEKGLKDVKVRWVVSKKDGAKNFAMRVFEIKPDGYTPLHQHDWEHEVFVIEGNGLLKDNKNEKPFKQGDVFFIPSMEWHQFFNSGNKTMKIICCIPYK